MSNRSFDNICKVLEVRKAKDALETWTAARARKDLTEDEIRFLDGSIAASRKWLETAKEATSRWWE